LCFISFIPFNTQINQWQGCFNIYHSGYAHYFKGEKSAGETNRDSILSVILTVAERARADHQD
jgi:glycerol-3-phosphate cytidylyltransferase-like family protein